MQVEISPKNDIRTTVPVTLNIKALVKPKVNVLGLGTVDVVKIKDIYSAVFWAQKPGLYEVVVTGKSETFKKTLKISEQHYMSFKYEFGFFMLLFILFSTGLVLWMRKIKKS